MAGEVGHVVYAARTLTYLGDAVSDTAFWSGTLFPDIRHLGILSRQRTHMPDVTLDTLVGDSDFATGMRVHAWIDATRHQFFQEANTKETLPWHPFVPHALKLVEDELLYDRFDDWQLVHRALNTVRDEELQHISLLQHITKWHTVLQDYFKQKPTDESRYQLAVAIGLSDSSAQEINNVVKLLRKDSKTEELITRFVHHLEYLLR